MQRLEQDSQRRWDDVPLPESLTKAHPEPLTIDGESDTGSGPHCGQLTPAEMAMEPGASAIDNSEAAFGLGLGSLIEAEPMTREEADAFDATPMDACFLELQMFSLSSMEPSQQASNTASAISNPAGSDQGGRGFMYGSRSTAEHTSSASNATNPFSQMVTQPGENNDSNRSSFETVDCSVQQQQHRVSAAMQTSLYTNAPQCMPPGQAYASAPGPDPWRASRRFDHTPAGGSDKGHDGTHSNRQQDSQHQRDHGGAASCMSCVPNARTVAQPHLRQAAAMQAFGLPQVQTTPALRQSAMQISLGMDVGQGLNLNCWQYGNEGPSVSMVLEAMDCQASEAACQAAGVMAGDCPPANAAEADECRVAQLTSAMIPAPATPAGASEAQRDEDLAIPETVSMPERCGSLPRLDIVAPKDPLQHHDAPMSALGRCPDLQEPSGLSPKGSCRSLGGGELSQRMESLERYRDKKRRRLFSGAKTIRYEKRKVNADRRPRVKGRFVKQSDFDDLHLGDVKEEDAEGHASLREFRRMGATSQGSTRIGVQVVILGSEPPLMQQF